MDEDLSVVSYTSAPAQGSELSPVDAGNVVEAVDADVVATQGLPPASPTPSQAPTLTMGAEAVNDTQGFADDADAMHMGDDDPPNLSNVPGLPSTPSVSAPQRKTRKLRRNDSNCSLTYLHTEHIQVASKRTDTPSVLSSVPTRSNFSITYIRTQRSICSLTYLRTDFYISTFLHFYNSAMYERATAIVLVTAMYAC